MCRMHFIAAALLVVGVVGCCSLASAHDYFVDVNGIGGPPSDLNPGTITQPWKTVQHAFQSVNAPGITVYCRAGEYYTSGALGYIYYFTVSGTEANPIVFQAYNGEKVLWTNHKTFSQWTLCPGPNPIYKCDQPTSASSLFVCSVSPSGGTWPTNTYTGVMLTIAGTNYTDWGTSTDITGPGQFIRTRTTGVTSATVYIWMPDGDSPASHTVRLCYNKVGQSYTLLLQETNPTKETNWLIFDGITFEGGYYCAAVRSDHITFRNCTFRYAYSEGLKVDGCGMVNYPPGEWLDWNSEYGLVENCEFYQISGGMIGQTGGDYWTIRDNYFHDSSIGDMARGAGSGFYTKDNSLYGLIERNLFVNVGGIDIGGQTHGGLPREAEYTTFRNNILVNVPRGDLPWMANIWNGCALDFYAGQNSLVANNLFYNCHPNNSFIRMATSAVGTGEYWSTTNTLENNIWSSCAVTLGVFFEDANPGTNFGIFDYNLIENVGAYVWQIDGVDHTWAQWQADGYDAHSISTAPTFVDALNGDFRPATSASIQVDHGKNLPGKVDDDCSGALRPQNGVTDIGPYEFVVPFHLVAEPRFTSGTTNTIAFSPPTYAAGLYLQWATDASFTAVVGYSETTMSVTSCTATGLDDEQTYYYRVKARNAALMYGPWSDVTSSTQDASPPQTEVEPLLVFQLTKSFIVSTTGTDFRSGLSSMHLFYKRGNTGSYTDYGITTGSIVFDTSSTGGDGSYYFYSIGKDQLGNEENPPPTADAQTGVLTEPKSPPVFSPEPEFTAGTSNTLEWSLAPGAIEYYLEWATDTSFTAVVGNSGWIPTRNATATTLTHGQEYSYRVKCRDGITPPSRWSTRESSTQDASKPTVPRLKDPGAYTSYTTVRFSWDAATDTVSRVDNYGVSVGKWPNAHNVFTGMVGNALSKTVTEKDGDGIKNGDKIYACVYARDRVGNISAWSQSSNGILIDTENPNQPGTPTDQGAFTSSTSVRFSWSLAKDVGTSASGVDSYELWVGTSKDSNNVFSGLIGATDAIVPGQNGQNLHAQVRARDRAGRKSPWSGDSNGITIDTIPPYLTDLVIETSVALKLTYSESVTGADQRDNYEISPSLTIERVDRLSAKEYRIRTIEPIPSIAHTLTINAKVKDSAGNSVNPASRNFNPMVSATKWHYYL